MDRRRFLRGLLALPVAAQLGRVYSFPTNIVIAKPVQTYVFGQDAIFCANLNQSTVKCYDKQFRANLEGYYYNYLNYSNLALITAIDPATAKVAKEMSFKAGLTLSGLVS